MLPGVDSGCCARPRRLVFGDAAGEVGDQPASERRVADFRADLRTVDVFVVVRGLAVRAEDFFATVFLAAAVLVGDLRVVDFLAFVVRAADFFAPLDFFAAVLFVAARRGCLALGPGFAPLSCRFTVAQARRSASSFDTPRSS